MIFSPYVTSKTLDRIVESAASVRCEIFTIFEAENFVAGASSIRALRRARDFGAELYHLPKLHAKVVLTSDSFATAGSQNATARGVQNREASVLLTDPEVVRDLRKKIEAWLVEAVRISDEMLDEMEVAVRPLLSEFKLIRQLAEAIDERVSAAESSRQLVIAEKQRLEA